MPKKQENQDHGHRARMRQKLRDPALGNSYLRSTADYELLELLLFYVHNRIDVKPLAKKLLQIHKKDAVKTTTQKDVVKLKKYEDTLKNELKAVQNKIKVAENTLAKSPKTNAHDEAETSLGALLAASREQLLRIDGVNDSTADFFALVHELHIRSLREKVVGKDRFSSWDELVKYCTIRFQHADVEHLHVVYLDHKNCVILDETIQRGDVDQLAFYPRDICKRALQHGAKSLVLVHNHPRGKSDPSAADIRATNRLQDAAEALNIHIHDHIVIGENDFSSFRTLGLLR